ncbi:4a-hydroxytetrahydrobiopterin dehydratase [Deltaproteobacteria bacterium PRO3]|nr:4a-hydroxytetrahydrobiopterin dehydratase [Deltaproteobacteria bacterium PRO3]
MTELLKKKCVPCEGGIPKLEGPVLQMMLQEVSGWELRGDRIHKDFRFKNFLQAMDFVNAMARLAEDEGHHPDFCVHYREVAVTIWTHAIGGLSENDFILAAKIDALPPPK